MKKSMIIAALLASALVLASCDTPDGSPSASVPDSAAVQTTAQAEITAVSETTAAESTEAASETTTESASESDAALTTAEDGSETTTAKTEMRGAPDLDLTAIAGTWYIDGDPTAASIKISADGKFKTYYASGNLENEGTIRRESEEIEGTTIYWYNLYDKDGKYVMGFADTGSSTDLYVGNGASPHYRKFGEGGLADDGRGPGEEFIDTWSCDRATLRIIQLSDGDFYAQIHWNSDALSYTDWDYPLVYQGGKLVCNGNATKTSVTYASADAAPVLNVEYKNGSGEFVMQDAGVVWNDLTEHSGDGMVFTRALPE